MAVRQFTAANSDEVRLSPGALVGMTYGTVAFVFRRLAVGQECDPFNITAADGNGNLLWYGFSQYDQNHTEWNGSTYSSVTPPQIGTEWWLAVQRKATGNVAPRISLYNFVTGVWYHINGNATSDLTTAVASTAVVRQRTQFSPYTNGRLAVTAAWKNAVPWTSDAALEAAGLQSSLAAWSGATPTALWAWNQTNTATPVTDLSGGGADQTAVAGTSVVTDDDPPGFTFAPPVTRVAGTPAVYQATAATTAPVVRASGTPTIYQATAATTAPVVRASGTPAVYQATAATSASPVRVAGTAAVYQATAATVDVQLRFFWNGAWRDGIVRTGFGAA